MPRPAFPPTPAPSTDIKGREYHHAAQHGPDFALPPSAIASRSNSASSSRGEPAEPPKPSVSPISPRAPVAAPHDDASSRKRSHAQSMSSAPAADAAAATLPPPPSRSRKIIQVKPKETPASKRASNADDDDYDPAAKGGGAAGGAGKKKNASTSAGRKIARKTAHSLIERRRRSKMNEEFGVLKDLIPACRGHEMHKLAILQASIDYLRYLETCVADLKAEGRQDAPPSMRPPHAEPGTAPGPNDHALQSTSSDEEEEDDEDEPMADRDEPPLKQHKPSVSHISIPSLSHTPTPGSSSTPLPPNFGPYREPARHYSQASSEAPSPFFGAQHARPGDWYRPPTAQSSYPASPSLHSQQTSPMLLPSASGNHSSELDREASAALLMLNASDRRTSVSKPAPSRLPAATGTARDRPSLKGISVKDLLSN